MQSKKIKFKIHFDLIFHLKINKFLLFRKFNYEVVFLLFKNSIVIEKNLKNSIRFSIFLVSIGLLFFYFGMSNPRRSRVRY